MTVREAFDAITLDTIAEWNWAGFYGYKPVRIAPESGGEVRQ